MAEPEPYEIRRVVRDLMAQGHSSTFVARTLRSNHGVNGIAAMRYAKQWSQGRAHQESADLWPMDPIPEKTFSGWETWLRKAIAAQREGRPAPSKRRRPSLESIERLAALYECNASDLLDGWSAYLPDQPDGDRLRRLSSVIAPTDHGYGGPVDRRQFVVGGLLAAGVGVGTGADAADLAALPAITGRRIGTSDVAEERIALNALYALDDAYGGQSVFERATEQAVRLRTLLDRASYSQPVGRDLPVVYGEALEMAGWTAFDSGRYNLARQLFTEALGVSHTVHNDGLAVLVLASMSLHASHLGAGREALRCAEEARNVAQRFGGPRLLSLLWSRQALAHAASREHRAAGNALAQSESLLREHDEPRQEWLAFWGPADFFGTVAGTHLILGDLRAGETASREALHHTGASFRRNRALYNGLLAEALIRQGILDDGASSLSQAITDSCPGRLTTQLQTMRPALEAGRTEPVIANCLSKLDQLN